jgi:hypothetical protein
MSDENHGDKASFIDGIKEQTFNYSPIYAMDYRKNGHQVRSFGSFP